MLFDITYSTLCLIAVTLFVIIYGECLYILMWHQLSNMQRLHRFVHTFFFVQVIRNIIQPTLVTVMIVGTVHQKHNHIIHPICTTLTQVIGMLINWYNLNHSVCTVVTWHRTRWALHVIHSSGPVWLQYTTCSPPDMVWTGHIWLCSSVSMVLF